MARAQERSSLSPSDMVHHGNAGVETSHSDSADNLGLGLDLVTPGSASSPGDGEALDPRLSADVAEPLGHVAVTGRGGGRPAAYPSSQVVAVYADRATVMPGLEELADVYAWISFFASSTTDSAFASSTTSIPRRPQPSFAMFS